jgi:AraC-like DNA-binding protein
LLVGDDPEVGAEAAGLLLDGVLVEWYRYPPGPAVALPTHAHEEYQLNLTVDVPGGVRYRGAYQVQPAGTLAVVMPGESHTPLDPDRRDATSRHLTLYLRPDDIASTARQLAGPTAAQRTGLPAFRDLVIDDAELVRHFARLHATLTAPASTLDRNVRLLTLLANLLDRHADGPRTGPPPTSIGAAGHRAVRRAREYLHDNLAANVSLAELADLGGVSPFHLTRLFTAGLGVPPHTYQLQLRIARAKRLLLTGMSASDTAHDVGYFDLSHFTRHFRRHVGTAPGAYVRGGLGPRFDERAGPSS